MLNLYVKMPYVGEYFPCMRASKGAACVYNGMWEAPADAPVTARINCGAGGAAIACVVVHAWEDPAAGIRHRTVAANGYATVLPPGWFVVIGAEDCCGAVVVGAGSEAEAVELVTRIGVIAGQPRFRRVHDVYDEGWCRRMLLEAVLSEPWCDVYVGAADTVDTAGVLLGCRALASKERDLVAVSDHTWMKLGPMTLPAAVMDLADRWDSVGDVRMHLMHGRFMCVFGINGTTMRYELRGVKPDAVIMESLTADEMRSLSYPVMAIYPTAM